MACYCKEIKNRCVSQIYTALFFLGTWYSKFKTGTLCILYTCIILFYCFLMQTSIEIQHKLDKLYFSKLIVTSNNTMPLWIMHNSPNSTRTLGACISLSGYFISTPRRCWRSGEKWNFFPNRNEKTLNNREIFGLLSYGKKSLKAVTHCTGVWA